MIPLVAALALASLVGCIAWVCAFLFARHQNLSKNRYVNRLVERSRIYREQVTTLRRSSIADHRAVQALLTASTRACSNLESITFRNIVTTSGIVDATVNLIDEAGIEAIDLVKESDPGMASRCKDLAALLDTAEGGRNVTDR